MISLRQSAAKMPMGTAIKMATTVTIRLPTKIAAAPNSGGECVGNQAVEKKNLKRLLFLKNGSESFAIKTMMARTERAATEVNIKRMPRPDNSLRRRLRAAFDDIVMDAVPSFIFLLRDLFPVSRFLLMTS